MRLLTSAVSAGVCLIAVPFWFRLSCSLLQPHCRYAVLCLPLFISFPAGKVFLLSNLALADVQMPMLCLPLFISFHPGTVFLLSKLAFAVVQMRMLSCHSNRYSDHNERHAQPAVKARVGDKPMLDASACDTVLVMVRHHD